LITQTLFSEYVSNEEIIKDMLVIRNKLLDFKIKSSNAIKNKSRMHEFYKTLNKSFAMPNKQLGNKI
ncbi:hypothetical protein, partial [Campylobacter sp. RM9328]|uniref:hypothetical protein n=1 Tax=Campylobacter sp. RM9328 TaxID=1705720 RepID=UPI0014739A9E